MICLFCVIIMEGDNEERSAQKICCIAGDEVGGVGSRGTAGEGTIYRQPTRFPGRRYLWASRECLLELRAGTKQQLGRWGQ